MGISARRSRHRPSRQPWRLRWRERGW